MKTGSCRILAQSRIEYDLEVAPGADVSQIGLTFEGFDSVHVDEGGDLVLRYGEHRLTQRRPKVLQNGREVVSWYERRAKKWGLALGNHDDSQPLTIDPVLDFATYVGGPGLDFLYGVTVDKSGLIYVAGVTNTPATPSLNPFQQPNIVASSAFVAKFSANADRLLLFSVLSSSGSSEARSVLVDSAGNMLFIGRTSSQDFPIQNAFQKDYKSAEYTVFVAKLASNGRTLMYSSYFGGSRNDIAFRSVLDADGAQVFVGHTSSPDIPLKDAYRSVKGGDSDCFVSKVNANGTLAFSTYFGGSGTDYCHGALALDNQGRVYIGGESYSDDLPLKNPIQTSLSPRSGFPTAFVARFSSDGRQLDYSTFFGGAGSGGPSTIAVNAVGEVFLAGHAYGGQFSTRNAFQSTCEPAVCGMITKLDATGQQILASTFLAGSGQSSILSLLIGLDGSIYVAGTTSSADFPSKDSVVPFVGGGIL